MTTVHRIHDAVWVAAWVALVCVATAAWWTFLLWLIEGAPR